MIMNRFLSAQANRLRPTTIARYTGGLSAETGNFTSGQPSPEALPLDDLKPIFDSLLETEPALFGYGVPRGDSELLAYLSSLGPSIGLSGPIPERQIMITQGAMGAAHIAAAGLIDPGDVVLAEDPSYPETLDAFAKSGARIVGISSDADGVNPKELERLCRLLSPKVLYVIPHFQNPRGTCTSLERRRLIAETARRYDLLVFEDDPYRNLYFDEKPLPSIFSMAPERTLFAGSFSKTVAPGFRCGWLAGPDELIERFVNIQAQTVVALPTFIHRAIARFAGSPQFAVHMDAFRSDLARRCRILCDALTEWSGRRVIFSEPKGGMFLWCRLPGQDGVQVQKRLLEQFNLAVIPGTEFSCQGECLDCIRLTYSRQPIERLKADAKKLAQALGAF
ncbi:aminotransferase, class I/II [Jonquetella anthropi E3_33 E1]|nr:aminotransferase, class I/II [Jonquetella anthropi E3_33 E1]